MPNKEHYVNHRKAATSAHRHGTHARVLSQKAKWINAMMELYISSAYNTYALSPSAFV